MSFLIAFDLFFVILSIVQVFILSRKYGDGDCHPFLIILWIAILVHWTSILIRDLK